MTSKMTCRRTFIANAVSFAATIPFSQSSIIAQAYASDEFAALSAEQKAFAERALVFLSDMEAMYFARVEELNGTVALETRDAVTERSDYNVKVARGPVVEKAGRMLSRSQQASADYETDRLWGRFFSVDVHPKTPLIGMLHAAFNFHFEADGSSTVGGWLDVLPGAMSEEDLAFLKATMDEIYAKYDKDSRQYRELGCTGDPARESHRWRRKPACIGGSFYSPNRLSVTEENFSFVTEAYEGFLDAYLTLIEKRKDDPYSAEDLAAQVAMRRNWLEDRLFSDPFTTKVTPYEIWSLSTLPPSVNF